MSPFEPAYARLEPVLYEQDGYVTTWQAEQMDVSRAVLTRLIGAGHLERVQRGVYRSIRGAPVMPRVEPALYADYLALDGQRLPWDRPQFQVAASHATAADLHGIGNVPADLHEFTSGRRRKSTRGSVRLWIAPLGFHDVEWMRDGRIPVTTPARTIVDMASSNTGRDYVERMLRDALRRHIVTPDSVVAEVNARVGRHAWNRIAWIRQALERDS